MNTPQGPRVLGTQEAPSIVSQPVETGPLPITSAEAKMVEGKDGVGIPAWLKPYSDGMPDKRALLNSSDQVHFDMLWRRAVGVDKPALSGREQRVLVAYLL